MRKKQEDEVQEGAAWMTTYADMVTLLFTFFVLMFAISSIDNEKFAMFLGAIQPGGLTDEKIAAIREVYNTDPDASTPITTESPTEDNTEDPLDPLDPLHHGEPEDPVETGDEAPAELVELYKQMGNLIEINDWMNIVEVLYGEDGGGDTLTIRFPGDAWFSPGSADLSPAMVENAKTVALLLANAFNDENPLNIFVSGHTDNVPHPKGQYEDNWDLGGARANKFMRILIIESGISSRHFYSETHADTIPVDPNADNNSEENRSKNRRVEVYIKQNRLPAQQAETPGPEPAEPSGAEPATGG
jgi:chemotaxis protein MotB